MESAREVSLDYLGLMRMRMGRHLTGLRPYPVSEPHPYPCKQTAWPTAKANIWTPAGATGSM